MSFEDFNFTRRTHCPDCKTSMIVIDKNVIFCPLCELRRREKNSELEKKHAVCQKVW
ncbi:MAG: hypothetical protein ACW96X_06890 [Promethearchaeota archaeon]|jgi:uncharacterized Zn finger protein (UPF0148 family)